MAPRTAKLVEWVGKTPESMPGQIVLLRLYAKQNGLCACGCTRVMSFERDVIHCDHKVPLADGGENVESNLQLMFQEHHVAKTKGENIARGKERTHKAKAFKQYRKPKGRPMPGTKASGLKKSFDGTVSRRF